MGEARQFRFTAQADVSLRVVARSEEEARAIVIDLLHNADTDFIRTDHWPVEKIVAEFAISDINPPRPTPEAG